MISNSISMGRRFGSCAGSVGHCAGLTHISMGKVLTFVFLIVVDHVSRIGGYIAQSQRSPHALLDTHRLAKRMDLEACLVQFDVHNNTIIRTGESQAIGGKYLQGLELDTMEECQRLCCETESCDVYIFEDKNGGYCYLFECGPPENFHCKFTRHANYTSAVLTPLKLVTTTPKPSIAVHQGTSNLSQQEWELTSLKVKPDVKEKQSDMTAGISTVTNINNGKQKQMLDIGFPPKASVNATIQKCSRFQFLCHSGECIAVYNACDGIPQCEDGSDEGPECSGATANNAVQSNAKGNVETDQTYRTLQETSQHQLQSLQQQQQQVQSTKTITSPIVNNREDVGAWANRKIVAESQQNVGANTGNLNSHIFTHKNGLQLPHNVVVGSTGSNSNTGAIDVNTGIGNYPNSNANLNPLYSATLPRNGVYLPQNLQGQQNEGIYAVPQQQMLDQQGRIYMPANVNWAQQQQPQQQQQLQPFPAVATPLNLPNDRGTQIVQGAPYVINTPNQAVLHFSQQQQQQQQQNKDTYITGNNDKVPIVVNQQQIPNTVGQLSLLPTTNNNKIEVEDSGKKVVGKANEISAANKDEITDEYEDESTEPPKKKPHKHKKVKAKVSNEIGKEPPSIPQADLTDDPVQQSMAQRKQQQQLQPQQPSPVHDQYKMTHENLAMEFRDHDGQSDRPGGAVLSLTLGVLVTAALAILIGCRMRTVGRRARRIGGKFSHEADFLVNGMYL